MSTEIVESNFENPPQLILKKQTSAKGLEIIYGILA